MERTFSSPYTQATVGVSSLVPYQFQVAIGGRNFLIDTKSEAFSRASIPLLRQQADQSDEFGEQSLSRELARKSQDSWHKGAGQNWLDKPESDRARFRSSKGIDVWTKWEMSLLPTTTSKRASVNTNLQALPVGTYLYVADGNDVLHTQSLSGAPTWTSSVIQAGEAAQPVKSITSDGYNLWAALGSNGIHTTTRGAVSSTHYSDLAATLVGYVKGRLMAAQGASIFNVIASGAAPAALFTQANTDFTWVAFAEGQQSIYFGGYSGDKSLIYRSTVKTDGTALDAPVVAGELPDGEILRSLQGYLGYLIIGTDKGFRFAAADDSGNLILGSLVSTTSPVRAFEPQDRFVWYGLENYDSTSTGLGRMDLSVFTSPLTPAYASDLMATTQGSVLSIATFGSKRFFAVSGVGFFYEDTNKVTSGTLDSGLITFGIPDLKVALKLDVRHRELSGTHKAYVSTDEGDFELKGTHATAGALTEAPFDIGEEVGEMFEIRQELLRAADTTVGPAITRHTIIAQPVPERNEVFDIPVLLYESELVNDMEFYSNPSADLDYLIALVRNKRPTTLQLGEESFSVFVEDYRFDYHHLNPDGTNWLGTCVLRIKSL